MYLIIKKRKQLLVENNLRKKKIEQCPQTQTKESCQLAVQSNFKLCKNEGKLIFPILEKIYTISLLPSPERNKLWQNFKNAKCHRWKGT